LFNSGLILLLLQPVCSTQLQQQQQQQQLPQRALLSLSANSMLLHLLPLPIFALAPVSALVALMKLGVGLKAKLINSFYL
jgi:hypothetical protein